MKARLISYLISLSVAFGILGVTAPTVIMLAAISAAPTVAQKNQSDTLPAVKPEVKPTADSTLPASSTDSLLDDVTAKAKQTGKNFGQVEVVADRVNSKLNKLQTRQARILNDITPVKIAVVAPRPTEVKEYPVNPDIPEIKPIEPQKASWWRRTFRND